MHDDMPYGRNQGQGQGHSREVDRQSPTGLIFLHFYLYVTFLSVYIAGRLFAVSYYCLLLLYYYIIIIIKTHCHSSKTANTRTHDKTKVNILTSASEMMLILVEMSCFNQHNAVE